MNKIVLSGYYGFGNAGDEAMLESILQALRTGDSTCEITVISGNPAVTAAKHSVRSIYVFDYLAIIATLRKCDLLISGGGSLLQNVTSWRSFYYYLSIMAVAKFFGAKVMLYAQGIGPVRGILSKKIMQLIVNRADFVTVRDEGSYSELRECGVSKPAIEITADAVLGMNPADTAKGRERLRDLGVDLSKTVIAVAPRRWGSNSDYLQSLASAADAIIETESAELVFMPLHLPDDRKVCDEIAALMRNKAFIFDGDCDAGTFMSVIGNCQLLIGVRLHALIFAAIMNVPIVGITYDPKIDRFLHSIGLTTADSVSTLSAVRLVEAARACLYDRNQLKKTLAVFMDALRKKALKNAETALQQIHKNR